MKKFKATIKIKHLNTLNNKYEFTWEGGPARSDVEILDVLIDAEEEIDAYSVIDKTSESTVEVLEIVSGTETDIKMADEAEQEVNDYMKGYLELCIPTDNNFILENVPISLGNN